MEYAEKSLLVAVPFRLMLLVIRRVVVVGADKPAVSSEFQRKLVEIDICPDPMVLEAVVKIHSVDEDHDTVHSIPPLKKNRGLAREPTPWRS